MQLIILKSYRKCENGKLGKVSKNEEKGFRDGAVMRALVSHQRGPDSASYEG